MVAINADSLGSKLDWATLTTCNSVLATCPASFSAMAGCKGKLHARCCH